MNDIIMMAMQEEAPRLASRNNVWFTGVGKVNAAIVTAELIERCRPRRVINFGTAGGITVGTGLHQVTRFVQRDMQCVRLGFEPGQTPYEYDLAIEFGHTGLTCSSGDNFVTDPNLEIAADLVDMEAYAIAKACQRRGIEFVCYKFVSDQANHDAGHDWSQMVSAGEQHYINQLYSLGVI